MEKRVHTIQINIFASLLKWIFPVCTVLFLSSQAIAQHQEQEVQPPAISLGLHGHYGFIIPHSTAVEGIANSNPWGMEVDVSLHFTDSNAWQYLQAYPRLGVSLAYFNFDNPEVLGNGYSLVVFAEPFLSAQKKFSLSFRLGMGLAYLDRVYDPQTNPENLFYSSSISFPLVANFMANYRLNERYLLRAGGTYHHISNAGISQPNKGINYPTASIGVNYALRAATFPNRKLEKGSAKANERDFRIALIAGAKDRPKSNSRKAPLLGVTAYGSQQIGRINALLLGLEWILDFALLEHLRDQNNYTDFQRGALLAGHEFVIGRFRFNQQIGVYLYAPYSAKDPVYQRYGLEYHTPQKFFFGINLKAHRHVADFLDARFGMHF